MTVIEPYFGATNGTILTDQEQRARIEQANREREASGGVPPCPPNLGVNRYTSGVHYLAMLQHDQSGGLSTRLLFRVDNADVLLGGRSAMSAATYHRFFEGIPAQVHEGIDYVQLSVDRVPLNVMVRAITALRRGVLPPIVAPDTGSAGLASGR